MAKKGLILAGGILALLFVGFVLIYGLTSCGDATTKANQTTKPNNPSNTTLSISDKTTSTSKETTSVDPTLLEQLIDAAIAKLDELVKPAIQKIGNQEIKNMVQSYYDSELRYLNAINNLDTARNATNKVVDDTNTFLNNELKPFAVNKLNELVQPGLNKIPNQEIKQELQSYSSTEVSKINDITKIEDIEPTLETILLETEAHIEELLIGTVKDYLQRLLYVETATAYDYLPEAMNPTNENNIVSLESITYDFSSPINVSNINKAGYGEQWAMVIENINQSIYMAAVFNVAQTALNAAGNLVDIYITNSYSEEMSYSFSGSGFTGLFEYKDLVLRFNITLTENINIPVIGSFKPTIKMEYDLSEDAKAIFISLGDAYKTKYLVKEDVYEMATTYGLTIAGKNASRSSYLVVEKNDNKTGGHIYEFTTYEGSDKIKACADFYVEDGYVSVVGNKSSGMIAFSGYINELYLANQGRLLGYEVREELTVAGVKGTYNTLWFNLWDISGINSVKVTDKTDANKSSKSTVDVYLNGSSSLLNPTYNTKLSVKTSRKYDVEYRNRYYTTYDSENDKYTLNEIKVPMMFIQEGDNYSSFVTDFKNDNSINVSVSLSSTYYVLYYNLLNLFATTVKTAKVSK